MIEFPETRNSLIIRLGDAEDRDAWDQFSHLYRPIVYRLARARGLQHADADDLAQTVLLSVSRAIKQWQPNGQPAQFRRWISRIAKNASINALTRMPTDRGRGGTSDDWLLSEVAQHDPGSSAQFEVDYRRQLYRRAAEVVRDRADETTWLAFSLTVIEGNPIAQVASRLQRSEGTIYAARSRIMKRLRDVVEDFEDR